MGIRSLPVLHHRRDRRRIYPQRGVGGPHATHRCSTRARLLLTAASGDSDGAGCRVHLAPGRGIEAGAAHEVEQYVRGERAISSGRKGSTPVRSRPPHRACRGCRTIVDSDDIGEFGGSVCSAY